MSTKEIDTSKMYIGNRCVELSSTEDYYDLDKITKGLNEKERRALLNFYIKIKELVENFEVT